MDIDQGLSDHLSERASERTSQGRRSEQPQSCSCGPLVLASNDPLLSEKSVDIVFVCDAIHHVQDSQGYFAKVSRALRPGHRLAIVDFYKRETPVGPPVAMKIAREDLISELREAGFVLAREFDFLPHQYVGNSLAGVGDLKLSYHFDGGLSLPERRPWPRKPRRRVSAIGRSGPIGGLTGDHEGTDGELFLYPISSPERRVNDGGQSFRK